MNVHHVVFHAYLWDGVQMGSNVDVDVAMIYCFLKKPEVFGVEQLDQLFPGIFDGEIHFGFDEVPGFNEELLENPEKFNNWLEQENAICLDCAGQYGNSSRIIDNDYQGGEEISATKKLIQMLEQQTDFELTEPLKKWVYDVNKTDTSYTHQGWVAKASDFTSCQMNVGSAQGRMGYKQALNWMAERLVNCFNTDKEKFNETVLTLRDHQIEFLREQLNFPAQINGRSLYIGPAFTEFTVQAAKSNWGGNCDLVVVQNKLNQIQLIGHQGKAQPLDLTEVAKVIRTQETKYEGKWTPDITEQELTQEENSAIEPCWFLLKDDDGSAWLLSNGGPKNKYAPPTGLTLQGVFTCLLIAMSRKFFFAGDEDHPPCPKNSCHGKTCPWYCYHLEKCKKVRKN